MEMLTGTPAAEMTFTHRIGDIRARTVNSIPDDKCLASFVDGLPKDIAEELLHRFAVDNIMLTPLQKRLNECLRNTHGTYVPPTKHASEPIVSVLTLAYNHEKYIAECIESVLEQRTNFPVQHIIVDDCSTDVTPEIIKKYAFKYPSITPVLLGGKGYGINVLGLFNRCRTEFAALCDGDDYFTDCDKLQLQVDFFRSHPECSICFHPVEVRFEDGSPSYIYPPEANLPGGVREIYTLKDLLQGNLIQTNSVMYRWRFRNGLPRWFDPKLVPGDWYWHLLHAETGDIGYIQKTMSVYRRHHASVYASAETGHVNHRKIHGLYELCTYDVCDRHFRRRYHKDFCKLANGVLADFVQIYMSTGDSFLLDEASKKYPLFTKHFLSDLKVISKK